jgi:hypothetical protein
MAAPDRTASTSKQLLPNGSRPHMAIRVGFGGPEIQLLCPQQRTIGPDRSAFPSKAAGIEAGQVRLPLTQPGHWRFGQEVEMALGALQKPPTRGRRSHSRSLRGDYCAAALISRRKAPRRRQSCTSFEPRCRRKKPSSLLVHRQAVTGFADFRREFPA